MVNPEGHLKKEAGVAVIGGNLCQLVDAFQTVRERVTVDKQFLGGYLYIAAAGEIGVQSMIKLGVVFIIVAQK